jgi:hypothetical protein
MTILSDLTIPALSGVRFVVITEDAIDRIGQPQILT